jgi:DNA-binding NarL/FixJ family response regulator
LRDIRSAKYSHVPRDIPFIMVTAHGQESVVKAAVQLDVNGYIVKPLSKDALVKAVHRAFNRTPAMKPPEDYSGVPLPPEP